MASTADDLPDPPELVSTRRDGDLVWLTIERPEVMNCLSLPTLRRLRALMEEIAADLSIRCVLFTGAGERAFCAGADLTERRGMSPEEVALFMQTIRATMRDVQALPQPTIAVVNGFALGGGCELMLACDLRVTAAHAKFGLPETTLAIIPGAGGTQRLPRLIGRNRAKDLILTGRRLDAEEAHRIGLVDRVAGEAGVIEMAGGGGGGRRRRRGGGGGGAGAGRRARGGVWGGLSNWRACGRRCARATVRWRCGPRRPRSTRGWRCPSPRAWRWRRPATKRSSPPRIGWRRWRPSRRSVGRSSRDASRRYSPKVTFNPLEVFCHDPWPGSRYQYWKYLMSPGRKLPSGPPPVKSRA